MLVPAGIYLLLSPPGASSGWGAVMATDIAFVVGCLALLGKRVPTSLKVFMLALAIVDDLGAILVIAIGYSGEFDISAFVVALFGIAAIVSLRWLGVRSLFAYWAAGFLTWAAMHESGIHPTVTGVVLGLLTPSKPWLDEQRFGGFLSWARQARHLGSAETVDHRTSKPVGKVVARAALESMPPQQRLENMLHPWSAFVVLPLFALANAGVIISFAGAFDPLFLPVSLGLFIGKPLGIFAFSWLATTIGLGQKPADVSWTMLLGASMLGGIGFTMSLFIANLAFGGEELQAAKFAILVASIASGIGGMIFISVLMRRH
jgi:NhaA family Na+:H+ antiporter